MSSRLAFVKKNLVPDHVPVESPDNSVHIVAVGTVRLALRTESEGVSGSKMLADSMKKALKRIKLGPESLQVVVVGSSLVATGQMPALTDNFSGQLGAPVSEYLLNHSSGLRPVIQGVRQV